MDKDSSSNIFNNICFFYLDIKNKHREIFQIKKIFIFMAEANIIFFLWELFCSAIVGDGVVKFIDNTFNIYFYIYN